MTSLAYTLAQSLIREGKAIYIQSPKRTPYAIACAILPPPHRHLPPPKANKEEKEERKKDRKKRKSYLPILAGIVPTKWLTARIHVVDINPIYKDGKNLPPSAISPLHLYFILH